MLALGAWIVALTLVVPSLGLAQTKNEYPLCWVPLAVGEVPNIPFSARLLPQTTHPVGADVKVSAPGTLGLVARDSTGRVIVRVRKIGADNEVESGWQVWQETICDPAKGTLTSVQYRTRQTSLARGYGKGSAGQRLPALVATLHPSAILRTCTHEEREVWWVAKS